MENSQQPQHPKDIRQAYRTAYLIAGFLKHTLNEAEKDELDEWIEASDENMILFEKMTDEDNIAQAADWFKKMNVEQGLAETKEKIKSRGTVRFWPYAVAAAVIVLVVAGIYLFRDGTHQTGDIPIAIQKQDIMPGSDKATLTLADGKIIELGSNGTDTTINDAVKVLRKDGELRYTPAPSSSELVYHVLTVPRKGQFKLVLPDGTKVWLNAASSIRYPVAFNNNERKVSITGEAYFEVNPHPLKGGNKVPFVVEKGDMAVTVTGTHFNVNAYDNEPQMKVTLLEGSVEVRRQKSEVSIKPGQQAVMMKDGTFNVENDVNVAQVIAWKENQFKFVNTPLDEIMRQVERWYDADVSYQDSIHLHLNASIGRDVPVSKLLDILAQTNQVHFTIEGRKIIVMK